MQHRLRDGVLEIRPETPLEGIELGKLYRDMQRRRYDCRIDDSRPALVVTPAPAPAESARKHGPDPDPDARAASDVTPIPEGLAP